LGLGVIFDISVPVSSVPSFINKAIEFINKITPDALTLVFGHTGDGNIHYCVMQPQEGGLAKFKSLKSALTPSVNDLAISFNDGFTAEHGVALAKADELLRYRAETEIKVMRQIKMTLDPQGICNPGKVFSK
jgi:FAD/FMN-containing dehydrogenase